jgi:hypothetical protein
VSWVPGRISPSVFGPCLQILERPSSAGALSNAGSSLAHSWANRLFSRRASFSSTDSLDSLAAISKDLFLNQFVEMPKGGWTHLERSRLWIFPWFSSRYGDTSYQSLSQCNAVLLTTAEPRLLRATATETRSLSAEYGRVRPLRDTRVLRGLIAAPGFRCGADGGRSGR